MPVGHGYVRGMKITVLGLGRMGTPISYRLHQAGHEVHVWNRNPAKSTDCQSWGAHPHTDPCTAVAGAECVISALADGPAVADVLFGLGVAQAMAQRSLFIDMASIKPAEARAHAQRLGELGVRQLDAPVSGGTVGAEQGTLAIMVGGEVADFDSAAPVFAALGHATHVGPSGTGQMAKLANQMIVGVTIGAVAEALLFAASGGADMGKVRQAITGGFADSRILALHGQRMVERDFAARATITTQLKDMRNALATARELGFDAPVATLFESLYADAVEHGFAALDHSGLFAELARRNGQQ